jgi:hypothetical protein
MCVGSALGILMISLVSVTRQTERENDIYREGFAKGHRIGLREGKVLKIDAALYEELKARASERVDIPPGNDSVRASPGFQRDGGDKTERRCNQCVHCGQEMPEGDQVCGYCRRKHGY